MGFKGSFLQGDELISPDVLKQLIDNDNYLYKAAPTIFLRYPAGQGFAHGSHSTREGDAMKITCGSKRWSNVKGGRDVQIELPAIKTPGPPVLLLTVKSEKGAPAVANIVSYSAGYKTANVRIQIIGSKTVGNLILHWACIHAVPDN